MDFERLSLALFGAVVGSAGWLVVGMYLQRRDATRRARSGARAVWFEVRNNTLNVELARDHGQFLPLSRVTFERLLPDLAAWLPLQELESVARPYQGHAGYEQAWRDESLPSPVRAAILGGLVDAHRAASDVLAQRAFDRAVRPAPMSTPSSDAVTGRR
jgi:hypothetical protein